MCSSTKFLVFSRCTPRRLQTSFQNSHRNGLHFVLPNVRPVSEHELDVFPVVLGKGVDRFASVSITSPTYTASSPSPPTGIRDVDSCISLPAVPRPSGAPRRNRACCCKPKPSSLPFCSLAKICGDGPITERETRVFLASRQKVPSTLAGTRGNSPCDRKRSVTFSNVGTSSPGTSRLNSFKNCCTGRGP